MYIYICVCVCVCFVRVYITLCPPQVSNDRDDLPDRFGASSGASANVVCRAARVLSLLSPDGAAS